MDIALDTTTGDIDLSTGGMRMTQTLAESVSQKLRIRFSFFLGEWYLDQRIGVPYTQMIMQKGVPQTLINSKLQKVVLTCPGISSLVSFSGVVDATTRAVTVTFEAVLTNGEPLTWAQVFSL